MIHLNSAITKHYSESSCSDYSQLKDRGFLVRQDNKIQIYAAYKYKDSNKENKQHWEDAYMLILVRGELAPINGIKSIRQSKEDHFYRVLRDPLLLKQHIVRKY